MFVPIILSAAGQMNSFFISELTLTNEERPVPSSTTSTIMRPLAKALALLRMFSRRESSKSLMTAMVCLRGLGVPVHEQGDRTVAFREPAFDLATPPSLAPILRTATRNRRRRAAVCFQRSTSFGMPDHSLHISLDCARTVSKSLPIWLCRMQGIKRLGGGHRASTYGFIQRLSD